MCETRPECCRTKRWGLYGCNPTIPAGIPLTSMHCAAKGLFFFVILSLVASLVAQYENEPNISADAFFQNHSHMSVFRRLES